MVVISWKCVTRKRVSERVSAGDSRSQSLPALEQRKTAIEQPASGCSIIRRHHRRARISAEYEASLAVNSLQKQQKQPGLLRFRSPPGGFACVGLGWRFGARLRLRGGGPYARGKSNGRAAMNVRASAEAVAAGREEALG